MNGFYQIINEEEMVMQQIIKFFSLFFFAAFFMFVFSACSNRGGAVVLENPEGRVIIESEGDRYPYYDGEAYYPDDMINIPEGHMPPPGKCRIWYPDRPPGQQPPPGDCEYLRHRVPPGAWLIRN
jgi:hypothetical protein